MRIFGSATQTAPCQDTFLPRARSKSASSTSSNSSLIKRWSLPFHPIRKSHHEKEAGVTFGDLSSELEIKYRLAQDDLRFATETQGSVYFAADRQSAHDSIQACRQAYQRLLDHVQQKDIVQWLYTHWSPLFENMDQSLNAMNSFASAPLNTGYRTSASTAMKLP
ncbi:hypothetical protein DM01DRAFT_1370265 [Hesseltinella vesiculosa]|uniref:Uncharacterized protein n=1 Tax=Hesseltinella vesiculosa TaxID=101127 RepID=A0A1X2GWK4_9FUNG|nr:hypothetical protein DM01DRAFT_1370265 [Hesseltinella vesiculosa]